MIAADVALAFNGANERRTWSARPYASNGNEMVYFTTSTNLVTIILDCNTLRFKVDFNKLHSAWGDYIRAIVHSLHVVLSTLKAAGMPFDAPEPTDETQIDVTAEGMVFVKCAHSIIDPIMPELKAQQP